MSTIVIWTPPERFLNLRRPLIKSTVVVVSLMLLQIWKRPSSALEHAVSAITTYCRLLLFSGFCLIDAQNIIKRAESTVLAEFDPINEAVELSNYHQLHAKFLITLFR
jgi:FtsH-binding integral membrane protein